MWFHFDRHGKYRGYSTSPLFWIAAILIIGALALAVGYQLFVLAPALALPALAIWAWTWQIRKWRAQREQKLRAEQPQN